MALRTNTIEYCFAFSAGSVASATARDFTQLAALAIPESTSRTFRSVVLEVSCTDNQLSAGASVTAVLIGVALGAVARSDATVTQTITNSNENQGFLWSRDVTSYFVTNYTGTSMTADCRLTVTGTSTQDASAKLIITYEYDDASQTTRIKTVKIPVDGNTGNLTTTFANLGGVANQWPALDTFLPEASKTYRDIFFQMDTHSGTTAAATSNLDMRYDGATTISSTSWGWSLNSDVYYRRIDKLTGLATNATHNIEAKCVSTTGSPFPCLCGVIVVTYEYNHSTTTTFLNSLEIPLYSEPGRIGGTVTGDRSAFKIEFPIEEPATITLVQSGVMIGTIDSGAVTLDVRAGSQASRTYTHAASAHCGGMTSMRRIDSGESGGVAGISIARGFNTFTLNIFSTSATAGNIGTSTSGILYLNYTSGLHASGSGVHNHTTSWGIRDYATGGLVERLQAASSSTPNIPETSYYLTAVGYTFCILTSGTSSSLNSTNIACEVQSGEYEAAGWRAIQTMMFASDAEIGPYLSWAKFNDFKLYPNDPDSTKLGIETARDYRYDSALTALAIFFGRCLVTYHAITFTISGTISSSAGGTVNIAAYRTDNGKKIDATSRTGNGTYSMIWYDNVVGIFTEAIESSTLRGRSDNLVAS